LVFSQCVIHDNWSEENGGGILCHDQPSPTFINCLISNNSTDRYGGGVYCAGASPEFTDCIITNNSAPNGQAGGVHCSHAAPTFTNCTISDNSAGSNGGAIDLYGVTSTSSFTNCIISGNSTLTRGGGLHCTGSASPSLVGCTISDNTANQNGGGLFCSTSASPTFDHCFISNNSGNEGGGIYSVNAYFTSTDCIINNNVANYGGGVYCLGTTDTLTKCTITGNSATGSGGGVYCREATTVFNSTIISFSDGDGLFFRNGSTTLFEYGDVYGNSGGDIAFFDDDPSHGPAGVGELTTTNANGDSCDTYYTIFLNPMFIDTAANDYHLLAGSPCIDAGDPDLPLNPDSSIADIGAFYFQGHPPSPFDLLSPTNGETVDTLDVTLIWSSSSDPDSGDSITFYRVYIALDSAFSTELDSQNVSATELTWEGLVDGQTYWWRVKAFDTQDMGTFSNQAWNFTSVASGISSDVVLLPTEFALHQNYPNPFNPTTTIRYDVKQTGLVSVKVFDILGREVTTLVSGTVSAGFHKVTWDAQGLPSGLYLCRMEAPGFERTRKLVLLK
ncbi:T9SS type A sorting domain-containing protein, partial [bacterium]|nr:T9SS type A sorting domain-containing protein [bacterium]